MSEQLNEMDVYMKKHLEQQRKKKIIRWVCLILAVILLWVFRTDLLALILPTDAPALLEQKYCLGGNTASCAE